MKIGDDEFVAGLLNDPPATETAGPERAGVPRMVDHLLGPIDTIALVLDPWEGFAVRDLGPHGGNLCAESVTEFPGTRFGVRYQRTPSLRGMAHRTNDSQNLCVVRYSISF